MHYSSLKKEEIMQIVLKHNVYRIKNGYAARSPELGLTAHGFSPEIAKRNLERMGLLFLRPFERKGNVREEIQLLGLSIKHNEGELSVSTND